MEVQTSTAHKCWLSTQNSCTTIHWLKGNKGNKLAHANSISKSTGIQDGFTNARGVTSTLKMLLIHPGVENTPWWKNIKGSSCCPCDQQFNLSQIWNDSGRGFLLIIVCIKYRKGNDAMPRHDFFLGYSVLNSISQRNIGGVEGNHVPIYKSLQWTWMTFKLLILYVNVVAFYKVLWHRYFLKKVKNLMDKLWLSLKHTHDMPIAQTSLSINIKTMWRKLALRMKII